MGREARADGFTSAAAERHRRGWRNLDREINWFNFVNMHTPREIFERSEVRRHNAGRTLRTLSCKPGLLLRITGARFKRRD